MTTSALSAPAIGSVFCCVVPVRWGDLDAQNHVNNTVYFRYFEEARVQFFRSAGIDLAQNKVGILVHASCDFLKPIQYPATLDVRLVLTRVGRSSMEFESVIVCHDNPEVVYARGINVIVGADVVTGKSTAWTPSELTALAQRFTA